MGGMGGGTGIGVRFTREEIKEDLIKFLKEEIVNEGDSVTQWDNLGDIMDRSAIGARGAGIQLVHYLTQRYGLPVDELKTKNSYGYMINGLAIYVFQKLKRLNIGVAE